MEYFHGYIEEIAGAGSVVNKHYFISGHERVEDWHSGILMNYNEFASLEQELIHNSTLYSDGRERER